MGSIQQLLISYIMSWKIKKKPSLIGCCFLKSSWVLFFAIFYYCSFFLLHNFCGCMSFIFFPIFLLMLLFCCCIIFTGAKSIWHFKWNISPLHTISFLIFFACKDIKEKNSNLMLVFSDSFFTSLTLKLTSSEF